MAKKHILLQGFGSFPLVFAALIAHARAVGDESVEWSIICTTGHHVEMFRELLGTEAVHYLQKDMSNYRNDPDLLDRLSTYAGNIYRNIESEKRYTKHKLAARQLKSAAAMYVSVKSFMQRRKPTHVLFGQIEGMDGMTLLSVAKELGIPALVPSHTRHMGETFLSPDNVETVPQREVTQEHRAKAEEFLRRFRAADTSAGGAATKLAQDIDDRWPCPRPSAWGRAAGFARRLIDEPDMREPDVFRAMLFINVPYLAKAVWDARGAINRRFYDITVPEELPLRYAFYPLQYSPESSINTPAPYFVDQMRAIDAIRFALPSDMMLVVKEHPACMRLRPTSFLRALKKKAGVVMARVDMKSSDIVERAAITFSVSGTAALEAYLHGRPSLTLGGNFFASWLGGPAGVDNLAACVAEALQRRVTDAEIVENLARVYAASAPYVVACPLDTGSALAPMALRRSNIDIFWRHLLRETN
jgi:hypothetical protein